jgi:hypothetical protein
MVAWVIQQGGPRVLRWLRTVVTCFAFREEYFTELDAMVATVRQCHPDWPLVVGRGIPAATGVATFDVETPDSTSRWDLPVLLHLSGGEDDWRRIVRMKAWWLQKVWCRYGGLSGGPVRRIMWIDADGREHGVVAHLLDLWSQACLRQVVDLGPPEVPWPDGDQEILTELLEHVAASEGGPHVIKLDHDTYCGIPLADGRPRPDALVDHWMMSARMGRPAPRRGSDWPPPEHLRRAHREG